MPSAIRSAWGHLSGGPSAIIDQSKHRMRLAISLEAGKICSSVRLLDEELFLGMAFWFRQAGPARYLPAV